MNTTFVVIDGMLRGRPRAPAPDRAKGAVLEVAGFERAHQAKILRALKRTFGAQAGNEEWLRRFGFSAAGAAALKKSERENEE